MYWNARKAALSADKPNKPDRSGETYSFTSAAIPLDAATRKTSVGSVVPGEIVNRQPEPGSYRERSADSIPLSSLAERAAILKGLAKLIGRNTGQTLAQLFRASQAESDFEPVLRVAP